MYDLIMTLVRYGLVYQCISRVLVGFWLFWGWGGGGGGGGREGVCGLAHMGLLVGYGSVWLEMLSASYCW